MTMNQKQRILELHRQGQAYAEIADAVGVPRNTVKTFCWRSRKPVCGASKETGIEEIKEKRTQCEYCDKPLEQRPKQKPRRFCDDTCRHAWWRENRDRLNRKAVYPIVCARCGTAFDSYGNKGRKYCCHECYIAARFGDGAREAVASA